MRRRLSSLSVGTVAIGVESLTCLLLVLFISTGKRAEFLKNFGSHADVVIALLLLAGFVLFHRFVSRRLLPQLERRFFPRPYEERRIFFGLNQEVRAASNIKQLYAAIARRIAESFEADDVSVLVRDEASGDYVCAASSSQSDTFQTREQPRVETLKPRLAHDAFVVKRLNRLSTPLVIEPGEIETWTRAMGSAPPAQRQARLREHESLRRLKSHLLVQIGTKDRLVGILSLSLRRTQFRYSPTDREILMSIAGQLALIVENSHLAERMVAQERLKRELDLAAEVQRRLLPAKPPEHTSLQLAGYCEPARGVGGDYYDFISVDKDRFGIAVADVAGKGMPAALLMSSVQATLRSLTTTNDSSSHAVPSLAPIVSKLNRLIFHSTSGENYVTFFYAHFDCVTRKLTYVNAGHNPPLYLPRGNPVKFRQLTAGGLITGVFEHNEYEQETLQMQPGDLMFLYTDGLSEALNAEGDEFGERRIEEMLASVAPLAAEEIRAEIVSRVKRWRGNVPLHDDLTFVVMKVN